MLRRVMGVYLLVFLSVSSFSNLLAMDLKDLVEIDATNNEILDAIIDSLKKHDLNCVNTVKGSKMKASKLNIKDVFNKNYTLTVSSDRSQPLIFLEKIGALNSMKNKNQMTVTTDESMKVVTKINALSYDNVTRERVNVGTIIEPIYKEIVVDGAPFEIINCE